MSTDSTIKFNHAPDLKVDINTGKTSFADLFVLGALQVTSRIEYSAKNPCYEFATDHLGLERLISKSNEVQQRLNNAIATLGILLTDAKSEEVQENSRELAWLLVGLTELLSKVTLNNAEMNHTLRTKKPSN